MVLCASCNICEDYAEISENSISNGFTIRTARQRLSYAPLNELLLFSVLNFDTIVNR